MMVGASQGSEFVIVEIAGRLVRPDAVVAEALTVVGAGVGTTVGISVLLTGIGMTVGKDDVEV